ncbi:MAG: hypothetical protein D6722_05820 [Bacteroidetes bacterium]|nr:MAG: hypothetical protein D6722_05820 [Bacteroidota bacterium]
MKYLLLSLLGLMLAFAPLESPAASAAPEQPTARRADTWGWVALGMGAASVAMIAVPYLSLPGLILGVAAVVIARLVRKKIRRPGVARLAAGLGGLSIAFFLLALGLIWFF